MGAILLVIVSVVAWNWGKIYKHEGKTETTKEMELTEAIKENNGRMIVIDPGHGGKDPGKVGVNGQLEKDINLQIGLKLKEALLAEGYEVVLTREEDRHLGEGEKFRKTADLNMRCNIINEATEKNQNTIMISIHQNSFGNQKVKGAQCFYYHTSEESKTLAEKLQQKLNSQVNKEKEKKTKSNNSYYMLINSHCPGVIIECGFLSNPEEEANLTDSTYQENLAKTIVEGIEEYYS